MSTTLTESQELTSEAARLRVRLEGVYKEIDALVEKSALAIKHIKEEKKDATSSKEHGKSKEEKESLDAKEKEAKEMEIAAKAVVREWSPETGSIFIRLVLGQVNVKVSRQKDRLVLKQEYEKFKRRTNMLFLTLVGLAFFIFNNRYFSSNFFSTAFLLMTEVWCLYYYTSMVLRENILKVNGSNIAGWWINHHYLSMIACVVFMFWPVDSESRQATAPHMGAFLIFQGLVQHLLNRYQLSRLYRLVAMGRASTMDVMPESEVREGVSKLWAPQVWTLFPFILATQLFEFYVSYKILSFDYIHGLREWQAIVIGCLLTVIGGGNFATTTVSYIKKWRFGDKNEKNK